MSGANAEAATDLYVALGRLVRELRRTAGGSPIGPSAMSAMVTLSRADGGLRLGELAEAEGISAPSLTRIVHVLEEQGLAARTPDPDDRRCQVVALTDAGLSLITSGTESRRRALRERLDGLSEEHQALLRAALPAFEALAAVPARTG